ncbi:MAG: L,D-transpeptidase [Croceitalea sp.]|nr:L,D-transpeptidase [Croceitalea sp.]
MKKAIVIKIVLFCALLKGPIAMTLAQDIPLYGHDLNALTAEKLPRLEVLKVAEDISVENYFAYMDSIVANLSSFSGYELTEHLLVRHNAWIMDTLAATDYYNMMERDSFVYDQRKLLVLRKGQLLNIPDSVTAHQLNNVLARTWIDINIPEFKLRIYQDSTLLYDFPIRVGQNKSKYLAMGDRITNLRTKAGIGHIVAHVKDPQFYNPTDGKRFYTTKRDDKKRTLMPQIPWLVTEVNGIQYGQLIHPTTNPTTLGKAYSNGCIGTNEGDAWLIYYHAPIATKVHLRYDLNVEDETGKKIELQDIYGYYQ